MACGKSSILREASLKEGSFVAKMLQRHPCHSNADKRSKVARHGVTCEVTLTNKLLQYLEEFICHLLLYLYKI